MGYFQQARTETCPHLWRGITPHNSTLNPKLQTSQEGGCFLKPFHAIRCCILIFAALFILLCFRIKASGRMHELNMKLCTFIQFDSFLDHTSKCSWCIIPLTCNIFGPTLSLQWHCLSIFLFLCKDATGQKLMQILMPYNVNISRMKAMVITKTTTRTRTGTTQQKQVWEDEV